MQDSLNDIHVGSEGVRENLPVPQSYDNLMSSLMIASLSFVHNSFRSIFIIRKPAGQLI
jgi:hypothetical protein